MENKTIAIINDQEILIHPALIKRNIGGVEVTCLANFSTGYTSVKNNNIQWLTNDEAIKRFTVYIKMAKEELLTEIDNEEIVEINKDIAKYNNALKQIS